MFFFVVSGGMKTQFIKSFFFRLNWCLAKDSWLCFRFVNCCFYSVAKLKFNGFARHVCLELSFIDIHPIFFSSCLDLYPCDKKGYCKR